MKKITIVLLVLFAFYCKKEKTETESQSNYAIPHQIEVHFGDKTSTISINDTFNILHDGKKIIGRVVDDKTKYEDETGKILYEVNYDNDGDFKLKDEKGELIWKIRKGPSKYKISNNEEGTDPYEIKKKDDSTLKLEKNDAEIGRVILSGGKISLEKSENNSYVNSDVLIIAYGFLFLPEISDIHKLILIAEGVHIQ